MAACVAISVVVPEGGKHTVHAGAPGLTQLEPCSRRLQACRVGLQAPVLRVLPELVLGFHHSGGKDVPGAD